MTIFVVVPSLANTINFNKTTSPEKIAEELIPTFQKLREGKDVIYIGEDHRDVFGKEVVMRMILGSDLVSQNSCLLLEIPEEYQASIDLLGIDLHLSQLKYNQQFHEFAKIFEKVAGRPPGNWVNLTNLFYYRNFGFSLFAIDQPSMDRVEVYSLFKKQELTDEDRALWVRKSLVERNQFMSTRISESFDRKECDNSTVIIGKAHLLQKGEVMSISVEPIPEIVGKSNVVIVVRECDARPSSCEKPEPRADLLIQIY